MPNDDARAAVGFSVTLSAALVAASMAMLALEGAYVWYALGSRSPRAGFIIFAILAALAIATSIFMAGKGITTARNAGFAGNWNLVAGKSDFNMQAIFLLVAIVMLGFMFSLSGSSKESVLEQKVESLRAEVGLLHQQLEERPQQKEIRDQLNKITVQIEDLRSQLPKKKAMGPKGKSD